MKFMYLHSEGGSVFVRSGHGRALQSCGHSFKFWKPATKSAFDAFGEYEPDVFVGTTYDLDRALVKCITARPHLKVALFASAWGPRVDNVDRKKFPIDLVKDEEKRLVEHLKATTGKPDCVFIHTSDEYVDGVLGGWRSIGVEPVGILNGFDVLAYGSGQPKPELECDWGFVGNKWSYKSINLDKYILPLCHPQSRLSGKIFGTGGWNDIPQWLGHIDDKDQADLYVSTKVCINVSEPHSTESSLGHDTIERLYKTMGAGGFLVSDYVPEAAELLFTKGECVFVKTPKEMFEAVRHYARYTAERSSFIEQGRATVWAEHTYHHRVAKLLQALGLTDEANTCLATLGKIIGLLF